MNMTDLGIHIRRLRNEGKTYTEIKDLLGCSKGTISYHCGIGQKDKQLVRGRERRSLFRKYLQEYKTNKICTDCGEDYPYWMMDFDHLEDKSFTISHLSNISSLDILEKEIAKCEIVCANCHRNRTHLRLVKNGSGVLDTSEQY